MNVYLSSPASYVTLCEDANETFFIADVFQGEFEDPLVVDVMGAIHNTAPK